MEYSKMGFFLCIPSICLIFYISDSIKNYIFKALKKHQLNDQQSLRNLLRFPIFSSGRA